MKNKYSIFDDIAYIILTQGKVAILNAADIDKIKDHKWRAFNSGHTWYAISTINTVKGRRSIMMHRIILSAVKGQQVDRINHNGLDNRRVNIRLCNNITNKYNSRPYKGLQYKGVCTHRRRNKTVYQARISVNKKRMSLGYYSTRLDAAKAYNEAAVLYHKEFASLNIIGGN